MYIVHVFACVSSLLICHNSQRLPITRKCVAAEVPTAKIRLQNNIVTSVRVSVKS